MRLLPLALLLIACHAHVDAPCGGAGTICPVAGTGEAASNGDGKPAAQTSFYLPSSVRVGPDGRIDIMDFNNMRLRQIGADGDVETIVGNGVHGVAVEGALAINSPLENPVDFAFAPDGAIILVELHDPRVVRVGGRAGSGRAGSENGAIEIIAGDGFPGDSGDGGPALAAEFTEIAAVAVAPDGTIYVSDDRAHRVRAIRNGVVTACAGAGAPGYSGDGGPAPKALLDKPEGLALDAEGRLYIADSGNHVIRRVEASGSIVTVAGTGKPGFSGDGGPAEKASFEHPQGVAIAPDGTLYIADTGNNALRRIDASGEISRVAGTGVAGYSGDGGPALAAELNGPNYLQVTSDGAYFADQRNNVVRVVFLR